MYDFRSHTRKPGSERLEPKPLVIVEWILILHIPLVREQMDYKLYLDVAGDIRFIRRLRRDIQERRRIWIPSGRCTRDSSGRRPASPTWCSILRMTWTRAR